MLEKILAVKSLADEKADLEQKCVSSVHVHVVSHLLPAILFQLVSLIPLILFLH